MSELLRLERRRVKLFSNPQARLAPNTSNDSEENRKAALVSSESKMLATVTRRMAVHNLGEMLSLKIIKAIRVVPTISKLLSNEALAAAVLRRPNISMAGARISSKIIPIMKGLSSFSIGGIISFLERLLKIRKSNIPSPAPR